MGLGMAFSRIHLRASVHRGAFSVNLSRRYSKHCRKEKVNALSGMLDSGSRTVAFHDRMPVCFSGEASGLTWTMFPRRPRSPPKIQPGSMTRGSQSSSTEMRAPACSQQGNHSFTIEERPLNRALGTPPFPRQVGRESRRRGEDSHL